MICQAQSLNIFLPGNIDKWDLHMLHWQAWEKGVKSLYYCRSKSIQRAGFAGSGEAKTEIEAAIWVGRDEMMAAFAGEHPVLKPARKGAIAHFLLQNWLADTLD